MKATTHVKRANRDWQSVQHVEKRRQSNGWKKQNKVNKKQHIQRVEKAKQSE